MPTVLPKSSDSPDRGDAGTPTPLRAAPPSQKPLDGAPPGRRPPPPPPSGSGGLGPAAPFPFPRAMTGDPAAPTREPLQRPAIGAYLSPRMTAIFGGIFGLATVTSIIALLIQVVPPRDERALLASMPGVSPSAAPTGVPLARVIERPKRVAIPGPWRIQELERDPTVAISSGVMEKRSFLEALAEKGVPKAQSYRIMKALDGLKKFDKTGKKDRFIVAIDRAAQKVKAFEYEVSPTEVYQAREGADGLLTGARLDMKIAESEFAGSFYVGKDLTASFKAGGFEDGVLEAINEALNGRLSTESFEEGGTVRLIAVEETALGLFARYKRIIAIEYRPPDPAEKPTRMYSFDGQSSHGYFDEKGKQPFTGGWRSPVPGAPMTSPFNPKRLHPVLHTVMPHNGTDLGAPMGTPVYSAYRGVVESVGPGGPSGNLVTILHPNGVTTGYAHLSRFAPNIKVGDKVGVHQLVGYVGSTGRSTGPHLHFSAKKDGKFFDAMTLQLDGERVMPPSDRPAFAAAKAELDRRLEAIPLPEPPPAPPEVAAAPAPAPAGSGRPAAPPSLLPIAAAGSRAGGGAGIGVVHVLGNVAAAAAAAAEPGIHPSQFVEDNSVDDDEGDPSSPAPAQGAPAGKPAAGQPAPVDPEDPDDNGE